MSDYEIIINYAKEIETILVEMGAEGKGLHSKVSSIKNELDESTIKSIRFIASIRNKLLHDSNFELTEDLLESFEDESEKVISDLTLDFDNYSSNHNNSTVNVFDDLGETIDATEDFEYEEEKKSSRSSSSWDNFSTGEKIGIGAVALGVTALFSLFSD
jgi:hypothetical protein